MNALSNPPFATFVVNLLAAIPLLGLGDFALDAITTRIGDQYGSLVYTSTRCDFLAFRHRLSYHQLIGLSNIMLLISSILFIRNHQILALQQSLIGCILANMLLLPALSIFCSEYRSKDLMHVVDSTRIKMALMIMAVSTFSIPTVFDHQTMLPDIPIAAMSRAIAIIFATAYVAYLVFEFYSHRHVFGYGDLTKLKDISFEERLVHARLETNISRKSL